MLSCGAPRLTSGGAFGARLGALVQVPADCGEVPGRGDAELGSRPAASVRAPRANAIAERFVGSIRRELLDQILVINQRHVCGALSEYEDHFNRHRPHRALVPLRPLPERRHARPTT
jgi:hypothetical protein